MAYPMIALTADGTTFAAAGISLTETGIAVLDEGGSRQGFVPYDSLAYVAPSADAAVTERSRTVVTTDGSEFGAASTSQTGAGVAVLDESGARIGFVPHDSLAHVLPRSKMGGSLPAKTKPAAGIAFADDGEADPNAAPIWDEEDDERDENGNDNDSDPDGYDPSGNDNDSDPDGDETEPSEQPADDADRDVGSDDPVWGGEPAAESERGDDEPTDDGAPESPRESAAEGETGADDGPTDDAGEREEAEESELVVEWSFGDE
ncbi:hypothetical protein JCM30237_28560 [Halolamina litorea]|uniref:Uncharacterized protein n=1 Tax=Halolamina litorea TaxID=1515593 RepID=A0ABD6BUC4_9EURY|nr:hypothetical protein [Halolamina litorea]